ncbi:MAG TPA: condensation domain-containing protein, partial [Aquella sp.]|nr:condensation domain-containing protein [Aquella sp.]
KGTSYRQWVEVLRNYTKNHLEEKKYWQAVLSGLEAAKYKLNKLASNHRNYTQLILDTQSTNSLLTICNYTYNTKINDLLLTAFMLALANLTNSTSNYLTLEGHGREEIADDVDVSRTIGWFTTMYPVKLEVASGDIGKSIIMVKELLDKVPNTGIGYGPLIGYIAPELAHVIFTYLGQFNQSVDSWGITDETAGISMHDSNKDINMINANGLIINNKLCFMIAARLSNDDLERFASDFKQQLLLIIKHTGDLWLNRNPLIQLINQSVSLKLLFMIHPVNAGYESYNELANSLAQKYKCYGIDNYNMQNDKQISNLYELASLYLSYIEEIRLQNNVATDAEYNLLGWSLGGHIALAIASILESRGISNINIICLDAIISDGDEKLVNIRSRLVLEIKEYEDKHYKQNSLKAIVSGWLVANELINYKLSWTNILLFKATKPNNNLKLEIMHKLDKHILQLNCNNIDNIIANTKQLKVINLDCNHFDILELFDEIRQATTLFINGY